MIIIIFISIYPKEPLYFLVYCYEWGSSEGGPKYI